MDSDQGKVFVGGISWETSEEKLKEYFNSFGSVLEAVIMKDRSTGRARGFGFVAFADPDVADKVLLEKHTIDGRVVEVKKAVPRDERQNSSKTNGGAPVAGNHNRTKKIFVGGLASSVTEDDFRNYFSQFGNITDVVVMYDPDTQRPRGFGFITFDSEDSVEKVLQQKTFHEIHEKLVEVKKAVPREMSAGRSNNGTGFGASRGAPYSNGYGQAASPNSANAYSGGARYVPPPPNGRGGYPPYSLSPYGPAYGAAPGYGMPMNGMFGAAAAYGGPGYPPAGAYGAGYGSTPAGAYGGAGFGPPGGYAGGPHIGVGPRSPWGAAGAGYGGSGGSPTAYGAGTPNGYSGANGYGGPVWNSGGNAPQVNGGGGGYGSYSSDLNHYANGTAAYPRAGGVGYDHYANPGSGAQYADGSWKSGESHASPASVGAGGAGFNGGVGMGSGSPVAATGYGAAGRQSQRGPDARFRPYPVNGERAA